MWLSSSDGGLRSKASREGSRERTRRVVSGSPFARALKRPAGTVFLEIGCVKSNGNGARFCRGGTGSALFPYDGCSSLCSALSVSGDSCNGTSETNPETVKCCGGGALTDALRSTSKAAGVGGADQWFPFPKSPLDVGGNLNEDMLLISPSSSSPPEILRCLFSLPCCSRPFASCTGGEGNGRPASADSGDWLLNERRGAATGGWKVKLGLNSEAAALSGLFKRFCEL